MHEKGLIRPATAQDAAKIAAVHVACWRESYGGIVTQDYLDNMSMEARFERWAKYLGAATPGSATFVLEVAGNILGFCDVGPAREDDFGVKGELYALYLLQQAQGAGWGRKLFNEGQKSLKSMGMQNMYAWVLAENKTRHFYSHLGGRQIGAKTIEIGGATLDEIAMVWEV
ncbi:MAG: GNAT family N-acetyltransferase [Micavibrio sp.]|nr:GNAT family N-acetyltransferase [Micavibrio sp.]